VGVGGGVGVAIDEDIEGGIAENTSGTGIGVNKGDPWAGIGLIVRETLGVPSSRLVISPGLAALTTLFGARFVLV